MAIRAYISNRDATNQRINLGSRIRKLVSPSCRITLEKTLCVDQGRRNLGDMFRHVSLGGALILEWFFVTPSQEKSGVTMQTGYPGETINKPLVL